MSLDELPFDEAGFRALIPASAEHLSMRVRTHFAQMRDVAFTFSYPSKPPKTMRRYLAFESDFPEYGTTVFGYAQPGTNVDSTSLISIPMGDIHGPKSQMILGVEVRVIDHTHSELSGYCRYDWAFQDLQRVWWYIAQLYFPNDDQRAYIERPDGFNLPRDLIYRADIENRSAFLVRLYGPLKPEPAKPAPDDYEARDADVIRDYTQTTLTVQQIHIKYGLNPNGRRVHQILRENNTPTRDELRKQGVYPPPKLHT